MKIEVSIGEIVDKLSILRIKKENIVDEQKLRNVLTEYEYLYDIVFSELQVSAADFQSLHAVNSVLWKIEDLIRLKEKDKQFDDSFIELARLVYQTNDERAELKKQINIKYGSKFVEEKSYAKY